MWRMWCRKRWLVACALALGAAGAVGRLSMPAWAQETAPTHEAAPTHEELVKMGAKASDAEMEWWRDAKFGIFIHWGVGFEKRHAWWSDRTDEVYWENLFKNLAKVDKFDATEWIGIVKDAGAKYVIFMTAQNGAMQRRPGGNFCLWDTKTTDNKITNPRSPFKRDVCAEIADAAHKADIRLEWYTGGRFGEGQRELLTKYGKVAGMWFDGGVAPEGKTAEDVYAEIRKLQPGILTNGGLAGTRYGGDYDSPQHNPPWPGWCSRPVEVAAILRNGYWYWDRPDPPVKPLKEVIGLLMTCVGQGTNLVLNLAPAPNGAMEPNEVNRIKEVGAWLKKSGESVYGTRPGPYSPSAWGVCTRKDRTIYLHMLNDLDGGRLALFPLNMKIVSGRLLAGGAAVTVKQTDDAVEITVPKEKVDPIDTIIALELDGPASDAKVVPPRLASVTTGKKATASSTWTWEGIGVTMETAGPQKAVDGDFNTGWSSRDEGRDSRTRWLEVDLGQEMTVDRGLVSVYGGLGENRKDIQGFRIECKSGDRWVACFNSDGLDAHAKRRWDHKVTFAPATARVFRLGVWGKASFVREFQLFAAEKK